MSRYQHEPKNLRTTPLMPKGKIKAQPSEDHRAALPPLPTVVLLAAAVLSLFTLATVPATTASATAQTTDPVPVWECPVKPRPTDPPRITLSRYGLYRDNGSGGEYNGGGWHKGTDIAFPGDSDEDEAYVAGTPVVAVEGGNAQVGTRNTQFGGWHFILHADSGNVYYYAHLQSRPYDSRFTQAEKNRWAASFKDNDPNNDIKYAYTRVEAGSVASGLGDTGNAREAHLHFEYRMGAVRNNLDPQPLIDEHC